LCSITSGPWSLTNGNRTCARPLQYIIRKAFDCSPDGKKYLPESILWRQKEQFSDGVGYDHINRSVRGTSCRQKSFGS